MPITASRDFYKTIISTVALSVSINTYAATQYAIEDLGPIPAGASPVVGINNNGDYTIAQDDGVGGVSTYIISNGQRTDIGSLGLGQAYAVAINDNNAVTGAALVAAEPEKRSAYLYNNGNITNIETIDVTNSYGRDLNNNGIVVGNLKLYELQQGNSFNKGFLYDSALGQMVLLDDIAPIFEGGMYGNPGWELIEANGVNTDGLITGYATVDYSMDDLPSAFFRKPRAYIFDGQTLTNLLTLGGDYSFGQAINDRGHVAGVSDLTHESFFVPPDVPHVFLYDGNTMNDLGTLSEGSIEGFPIVTAINEQDVIVGAVSFRGVERAFVAAGRKGVEDLDSMLPPNSIWTNLIRATDINDDGVIVGYGIINGETHGFKMSPVTGAEHACIYAPEHVCAKLTSNLNK